MATREQTVDSIKAGAGQRAVASEVETAVYQSIADLKSVINSLMDKMCKIQARLEVAESAVNKVYVLAEKVKLIDPLMESVSKHRDACALMAEKVDPSATPSPSFAATFNSNI